MNNTNWTGSMAGFPLSNKHLRSQVNIDLRKAIAEAEQEVGSNTTVVQASFGTVRGYLVYEISLIDSGNNLVRLTIDAGNSKVLSREQISCSCVQF